MAEPTFKPREIVGVEIPRNDSFLLKAGVSVLIGAFIGVILLVSEKHRSKPVPGTEWIMLAAGRNCVEKNGRFDCTSMTLNLGLRSDGVVVWR